MKTKLIFTLSLSILLGTACSTQIGSSPRAELLGAPAPASAATRTIAIEPDTRFVNVTGGETVNFTIGSKSFAWSFDNLLYLAPVNLQQLAPAGVLDRNVTAYVAPNPLYRHDNRGLGNTLWR